MNGSQAVVGNPGSWRKLWAARAFKLMKLETWELGVAIQILKDFHVYRLWMIIGC